jgi:nitrile hydratase accessory protein
MNESIDVLAAPRDGEGPVFEAPWQAQAFSMLVALNKAGHFAWKDWVQLFSRVIKSSPVLPGETANDAYYRQWASALEEMVISIGGVTRDEIASREQEWRSAYLNTPHGLPVKLLNASCRPIRSPHGKLLPGAPVTVSEARVT